MKPVRNAGASSSAATNATAIKTADRQRPASTSPTAVNAATSVMISPPPISDTVAIRPSIGAVRWVSAKSDVWASTAGSEATDVMNASDANHAMQTSTPRTLSVCRSVISVVATGCAKRSHPCVPTGSPSDVAYWKSGAPDVSNGGFLGSASGGACAGGTGWSAGPFGQARL